MEAILNGLLKEAGLKEMIDRQDAMELMGTIESHEMYSVATDMEELLFSVRKNRERNNTDT